MTEKEAFIAMFNYLDAIYDRDSSCELADILGDMQLLEDGQPADMACWNDWLKAINKPLDKSDIMLKLTKSKE